MGELGLGLGVNEAAITIRPDDSGGGGGDSYTAKAVHFDGAAWLSIASLTATDNNLISLVFWFKAATADYPSLTVYVSDPDSYNAVLTGAVTGDDPSTAGVSWEGANAAGSKLLLGTNAVLDTFPAAQWNCFIGTMDTSTGDLVIFNKDVDVSPSPAIDNSPFLNAFNGLPFFVGGDGGGGSVADFADVRIMPGIDLRTGANITEATRRLFVDAGGKPVDPAVATASLGSPCILFSGDATGFAINQGTGGAFTLTGTLTNASTSPSDDLPYTYTAKAVHFDGSCSFTSDALSTSDAPTGLFAGFFSIINGSNVNSPGVLWFTTNGGFWTITIGHTSIRAEFWDTTNTLEFRFSAEMATLTNGWHSFQISVDTNHPSGQKIGQIVLDRVLLSVTVDSDASPAFNIGWSQDADATQLLEPVYPVDLAVMYVAMGQYLDLSEIGNISKFVTTDNKPVDLGANGALPTGFAPTIFGNGDATEFMQPNVGTGGAFTLTGTLTNASTSPSDDAPSYTGPLDIVSGAVVAYSQRKLAAAWNDLVIEINNGTTTDSFGADTNNAVDPAAIQAFIDDGSIGICATWFDQSGNGNNARQSSAVNQPIWNSSAIGSHPGLEFMASPPPSLWLGTDSSISLSTDAMTVFAVIADTGISPSTICGLNWNDVAGPNGPDLVLSIQANSRLRVAISADSSGFSTFFSAENTGVPISDSFGLIDFTTTDSSVSIVCNGIDAIVPSPDLDTVGVITWPFGVGTDDVAQALTGNGSFFNGKIIELFIYDSALSDADRLAIRQNIALYYGITLGPSEIPVPRLMLGLDLLKLGTDQLILGV